MKECYIPYYNNEILLLKIKNQVVMPIFSNMEIYEECKKEFDLEDIKKSTCKEIPDPLVLMEILKPFLKKQNIKVVSDIRVLENGEVVFDWCSFSEEVN